MVREYLDKADLPAARTVGERVADGAAAAKAIAVWDRQLRRGWAGVHIGETNFTQRDSGWEVSVPIYLGEVAIEDVRVEVYAEGTGGAAGGGIAVSADGAGPGAISRDFPPGRVAGGGPQDDYTVRGTP